MSQRMIQHIDKRTGEELHGSLVWCQPKAKIFPSGYVAVSQKGLYELLEVYKLNAQQLLFLSRILKDIGYQNIIPYTASEFARSYKYSGTYVSRIFNELFELGVLVNFIKVGRCKYYALNSNIGWKGKVNKWYDNSDPNWHCEEVKRLYMLKVSQTDFASRV